MEKTENRKFNFDWERGMADYKEKYDSVRNEKI